MNQEIRYVDGELAIHQFDADDNVTVLYDGNDALCNLFGLLFAARLREVFQDMSGGSANTES